MYQLKIEHCTREDAELLSDLLELQGALSITMTDQFDDPILEPEVGTIPLWPNIVVQALYDDTDALDAITTILADQYPHLLCSTETVVQQDWERTCLLDFHPQRYGQRLWVCPSWLTPPDPAGIHLILDPGLAFGTGSHGTTALCLTWLEQAMLQDKTMIDYGCGSGILSIAALKLGAQHVYAVDIDPQALLATQSNGLVNDITADALTIDYPNVLSVPVDIIVANILLTPLLDLKTKFDALLHTQGLLVVSGILAHQSQQLSDHYASHFRLVGSEQEGDWALLVFEKITK